MKWLFLLIGLFCLNFVSADLISIGATGGDESNICEVFCYGGCFG